MYLPNCQEYLRWTRRQYGLALVFLCVIAYQLYSSTRPQPLLESDTTPKPSYFWRAGSLRRPEVSSDGGIGLGDVIQRATAAVGIRHCGGCERRAAALNRWAVFGQPLKESFRGVKVRRGGKR